MLNLLLPDLVLLVAVSVNGGAPPDRIWRGGAAPAATAGGELNVVSWNIERGEQLASVAEVLKQLQPALVLLQEVDMHAKRTGGANVAEHLAERLGLNYLFAAEFEELGQSRGGQPAYHGQAILTALPTSSARMIRFASQSGFWRPRWYLPNWAMNQRRNGGRLALVTEVGEGPCRLIVYNVHLESREGEDLRLRQIEQVIMDAQQYGTETPILLAGDLNTRQPSVPAVDALLRAGFRKAVGDENTTVRGRPLDWIFVRGPLDFQKGLIHRQVLASDHFPLTARIMPRCQASDRHRP